MHRYRPFCQARHIVVSLLAATFAMLTMPGFAADSPTATIAATNDLYRLDVDLPEIGTLSVYLPSDIRPGDRVTGRVETAPKKGGSGFNPALRLGFGQSVQPARDGLYIWDIGPNAGPNVMFDVLDGTGKSLIRVPVPLAGSTQAAKVIIPAHSGAGVTRIPAKMSPADQPGIEKLLDLNVDILAASPRAVIVHDKLVLGTGPLPVTCCAEGGPCGNSSCCVDIPSNGCTFCSFNDYPVCIKGTPSPD
jgi:hypothetical protein